jgi:glycosyltransferase involved in cell wall biosynthesis
MSDVRNDLVSVIVPTYNRAYCVTKAIDSVRSQTHVNWEIVVVDDGSTDGTESLIRSKYGTDAHIRYIYQPNSGVSAARNTGIFAAMGDYVAFLDSDDMWKPWKLEIQLACFRAFPGIGMVWTNFEAVNPAGEVVKDRYLRTMYEAYRFYPSYDDLFQRSYALTELPTFSGDRNQDARVYVGDIYCQMLRGNLVHTSTVLISRKGMQQVGAFDTNLTLSGEDYDFHFRTCKSGQVAFVDLPSTIYQLGFSDRLTQYSMQISQNFLKTVTGAIARERGTTAFSAGMVNDVLAEAHAWVAEEFFKKGNYTEVRRHALQALRHHTLQLRVILVLGLAMLPGGITRTILMAYRTCKRRWSGSTKAPPSLNLMRQP